MSSFDDTPEKPGFEHPQSRKDAALPLVQKGLYLIPVCWAEQGLCACGKGHTGHDIGKAPLTKRGVNDSSNSIRQAWEWWDKYPLANIGLDLDRSGLVDIAPDSEEWLETFKERGLPPTATFVSGGGVGHEHYLYRRPANTPLININKSGEYDIQPRGYCVAPGSLHQSGRTYQWITDFPWKDVEDLPFAPDWAVELIQDKWDARTAAPETEINHEQVELRPELIKGTLQEWWDGERAATRDDGTVDRSLTLCIIGNMLARRSATPAEIVSALRDRDEALGFYKYSSRKDGGLKAYSDIAETATATTGGATKRELTWEEVEAAVRTDPDVMARGQQKETVEDPTPEHPGFDGDGAARRRFTKKMGAEIRKTRDRLNLIWKDAQRRLGREDAIARADRCGGLWAQSCDNGHITAPAKKDRLNCKQRLHPRCLGTNMRKVFYLGKTRGTTKLDDEGDMDINIVRLGIFDVGEDPFDWAPNSRHQLTHVKKYLHDLRQHKNTPLSFRDAFTGWRVDLRRGCLTLDVVMVGTRDPDLPRWLKENLAEVASQRVLVERLQPLDHKDVIGEFGNLMSSAACYSDVDECLALLEALKGWQMTQPHGKFRRATTNTEEKATNVSKEDPDEESLETFVEPASGDDKKGGGASPDPPPPCPECGGTTRSAGFRTGYWAKVTGNHSKQLTWLLLKDDADLGGGPGEGFEDFREDVDRARGVESVLSEDGGDRI